MTSLSSGQDMTLGIRLLSLSHITFFNLIILAPLDDDFLPCQLYVGLKIETLPRKR
jgi:hypothetical protein